MQPYLGEIMGEVGIARRTGSELSIDDADALERLLSSLATQLEDDVAKTI